ncbi:PREDICTED: uncharacterized protein LOC109115242 [Nelumbo nucifera]|uniref:Uncharacterized protein LOC109115242 n=1 Tax=Nelumbo nucifera TaxID=4432 RepID=A0A1U8Q706_NELNU|nr:PREDICTED: uncharacterized protein LOC109115242 [Nelumbo nucifera]
MGRCTRAAVVWTVWEERNLRIFKDKERSKEVVIEMITLRVVHWVKTLKLFADFKIEDFFRSWGTIASSASRRSVINESWSPPNDGWKKLNFDGSCLGNPDPSGIGGVIREENGNVLAVFSGPNQHGDVESSEMKAAVLGVEKAKEMGIYRLIIGGDSKIVIKWLKKGEGIIWQLRNELRRFKQASKEMVIQIRWIRRSSNSMADGLAKQGIQRQSMFWAML